MGKKLAKSSVIVLLVVLVTNVLMGSSSFTVTQGTTLTYEVMDSTISGSVAGTNFTANGLKIAGHNVQKDNEFDITVKEVFFSSISVDYIYASYTENELVQSIEYKDELLYRLLYPYVEAAILVVQWNESYFSIEDYCLFRQFTAYIEPDQSTWDKLTNLENEFVDKYDAVFGDDLVTYLDQELVQKNNEKHFVCSFEVKIGPMLNRNFSYNLEYEFSYDLSTGHFLGNKIQGEGSGEINNISVAVSLLQHVELKGYNIEDFYLGEDASNLHFYETLICILGVYLIVKSRKLRKR